MRLRNATVPQRASTKKGFSTSSSRPRVFIASMRSEHCEKLTVRKETSQSKPRKRIYDEAASAALTILWETTDRICGKRLKEAIPTLIDAMELHGHLQLGGEVRQRLLVMSAATMDRLRKPVRESGKQGRRRTTINTPLRKSIAVRPLTIGTIRLRVTSKWIWLRTAEISRGKSCA